ncbi:putative ribonuclease H-like domain-containing protein [Tanacetum coccineum]
MPPKPDLSFSSLEEFIDEPTVSEPTIKKPVVETNEAKANSEDETESKPKIEKKTVKPSFAKIEFVKSKEQVKSPRKTTVKLCDQNRLNTHAPRGNQRNWNNMMSQRLGSDFEMFNKACYVCGSFDHLQVDCKRVNQKQFQNTKPISNNANRVNHENFAKKTHPYAKKNMVPRAVLMKSGLVSVNTARHVNVAQPKTTVNSARPMTNVFNKAHSIVKRSIHKNTTFKNSNFNQRVNTVKSKNVNAARPKAVVNVARPKAVLNATKGNQVNAVKASACWVWKPKTKFIDHVSKHNSASITLKKFDYIDAQGRSNGCSRHMIWNMSYLTDFEEIDGGYVAFGGNPKGEEITSRVSRKNNMYSVDLKNIVPKGGLTRLFSKSTSDESNLWHRRLGHINFKTMNKLVKGNLLTDENHVLLKVPRKNSMYSVDLKNIVPKEGLTCLFAKVTSDESNLWHKRLGHINFKTMNKLVKGNLVRGLPLKRFENNQTCVACQKGKQHRASFKSKTNKVIVVKPHNKTPYELFLGRKPALGFMRPFGCPVIILNTLDHLGKFDGKADEGFFVGYSINSKAFRVFNSRTRIVEENLHVQFSDNTPNIAGSGPNWLFDIDALTKSMNYKPVVTRNQSNGNAGTKACDDAGKDRMETVPGKDYILLPLWTVDPPFSQSSKNTPDDGFKPSGDCKKKVTEEPGKEGGDLSKDSESIDQEKVDNVNSTNTVNAASTNEVNDVGAKTSIALLDDLNMPELEDIVYSNDDEDVGEEANINNLDASMPVSPIPTTRVHKDHPVKQIIGDLNSAPQTRRMTKNLEEHGLFSSVKQRTNHKDFQNCLFTRFLSQEEPKKAHRQLNGVSEIKDGKRYCDLKLMQARLLQGSNKKKGSLWLIDYDEVFAPVARIEAIRLFLDYASFKDFVVYQMDVKSAFLYGKIEEEVYVCQPPGFEDPDFPDRVYKVEKTLYGLHQAPIAWYETLSTYLLDNGFQRGKIDKTLFIRRDEGDILTTSKAEGRWDFYQSRQKPLLKDEDGEEVDVHLYRSMIGSLMYLTSSRPGIMFAMCACARYQVNPKMSHLHAVKIIFRYLKGQPKLGLWYLKDSPFDLAAYTNSDYAGASLDRKSTIGGCQFLGCRLISWQCKKHTVVANSITETEYVDASSCCGQVLWIQNQLLDYGYNFMHTKIYIDNESTICIVKNHVFHSKTKHIEIRHHFIRDSNEKKLIQMIKIHTDKNVADLLTKVFDQFWATAKAITVNREVQLQALVDGKRAILTKSIVRRDLRLEDAEGIDCLSNATIFKELTRMGLERVPSATSLDAEQDRGSGPRCQEIIGDIIAQTGFKNVSKTSNGSLLAGVNTPRSDEDSLKLKELMELCTNLQNRVIDLEKTKRSKLEAIIVEKEARIESSKDEGLSEEDASKQGRIDDIDTNEDIYLVNVHRDEDMFGVNDLEGDEVIVETEVDHEVVVETEVASKDVNLSVDEVTLAQALAALKSAKPKADKVMLQEPEQGTITTTTAATTVTAASTRSKAKGLITAEFDERRDLTGKKDEANVALTEEWNDIQAKIDVDYQLAQILQAQEQEELTDEEKVRLFVQFLEQRRKHFAAKRVEEKRNIPPTRAQQRSIITKLMEESSKKVEVMEESSKKNEAEIAQESSLKRAGRSSGTRKLDLKSKKLKKNKSLLKCLNNVWKYSSDLRV